MLSSFIRIKSGAYRNFDASGKAFQLVEQFKQTAKGSYVTVKNNGNFPGFPEDVRIKVYNMGDYEFISMPEFQAAGFDGPVYLMPVGGVESVYSLNNRRVAELAMNKGWRYSDRLQVPLFKNEWGT